MENEKEAATNRQRDQSAATPFSIVETHLTISAHDGLTLPDEGKAQIGPIQERFRMKPREFLIAGERGPRHACPTRK